MKKALKIIGIVVATLLLLLIATFLLVRFVFREQAVDYLTGLMQEERVELIRKAGPYGSDTASFRFAYRQDTVRAREIRDFFRLDTLLAPGAATWDNALALARFVARSIPHENQKVYPEKSNAIALWEYTRTVEPAFNCRLHSILLHELLLASDIVNRFVTCLPADSLDSDCHVVNVVWLPERQKWAMLDSDQQAYVTDPAGTPLSLEEMRERLLDGRPMEVHHLLGGGRDFSYYLPYMAKNLFWLACWEETGYDKETARRKGVGRVINLVPPGFEGFNLNESAVRTTDAARFWAAPQTPDAAQTACAKEIEAFYKAYMRNAERNNSANGALLKKYLTDGLAARIRRIARATGADPILRAQDVNRDAIETLTVEALGGDWYRAGYLWKKGDESSRTEITLKAQRIGGRCRIVYITPPWHGSRYGDELTACGKPAGEIVQTSPQAFLKSFYDAYTALYCAMPADLDARLAALRARYLAPEASEQFRAAEAENRLDGLDGYDILIGNFDFDCAWGESLEIEPAGDDAFLVSYRAGNKTHAMRVTVEHQDGGYRIGSLLREK